MSKKKKKKSNTLTNPDQAKTHHLPTSLHAHFHRSELNKRQRAQSGHQIICKQEQDREQEQEQVQVQVEQEEEEEEKVQVQE